MSGAYGDHERIHFNRDEMLKAFLALSETLGLWKAQAGRLTKVRIMPETLARNPRLTSRAMTLNYRYLIAGEFTPWKSVAPVPEVGSTVVYLPGVHDEYMIQLQLLDGANQWISPATPQLINVQLEQVAGGAG